MKNRFQSCMLGLGLLLWVASAQADIGICQIQIVELPSFQPIYQSLSTQIYPQNNCQTMEQQRCEMWWPMIFSASAILNDPLRAEIKLKLGNGTAIPQLRHQCVPGDFPTYPIPEPVTSYRTVPVPPDFQNNYKDIPRLSPQPRGVPIGLWNQFVRVYQIITKYKDVIGWWVMSLIILNILLALAASGPSAGTSFAAAFAAIVALLIYSAQDFSPEDRDFLKSLPQASIELDETTHSIAFQDGTEQIVSGSKEAPRVSIRSENSTSQTRSQDGK